MMKDILDTLLLLALPASGKSEIRRYLQSLTSEVCRRDFHLGSTIQLDDYPYVHIMRRIDDELVASGEERIYFQAPDRPFRNSLNWGVLIQLINEDYADILGQRKRNPSSAAMDLFERLDAASASVGAKVFFRELPKIIQEKLAVVLESEARKMLHERQTHSLSSLEGCTVVIEFARGGPEGARMPLPSPLGYAYSLGQLSQAILQKAAILYVGVTPEESRRKNEARADPADPGSILQHGVPIEVMRKDYGCDDIDWLLTQSGKPGSVAVQAHKMIFHLPVARFDNRVDKTSFVRETHSAWQPEQVRSLHQGLKEAFDQLVSRTQSVSTLRSPFAELRDV
ncbi:MAG: hypothetical protein HY400_05370 [Elusimicrobia bacterium]|nr:hypothetical protein [Elusimicrobiota bacterium]